jgi:hypothetical protein
MSLIISTIIEWIQKIKEAVRKDNFDLIFSTRNMANYVDLDLKIVCPFDAVYEARRQVFTISEGLQRIVYGLRHALNRSCEKRIYEKFDACWVVTQLDKELRESLKLRKRCIVVPIGVDIDYIGVDIDYIGVDIDYFSPVDTEESSS